MKTRKRLLLFLLLFSGYSLFAQCGKWRRDVKILADQGATALLNQTPQATTIDELLAGQCQDHLTINMKWGTKPRYPEESRLVVVDVIVESYKIESNDQDYHIVLRSPDGDNTIVAEIPSPDCPDVAANPALQKRYRILRDWFKENVAHGRISTSMTDADPAVSFKVVGVPFWDGLHPGSGPSGGAENGREIHPIVDFIVAEGSVFANYKSSGSDDTPKATLVSPDNTTPQQPIDNSKSQPMNPSNTLTMLLLGAILGAAGQGIRVILGLKKVYDDATKQNVAASNLMEYKQLTLSMFIGLMIGAISGILAVVVDPDVNFTKSVIISFIAAGYAGTDFIEGFIKKYPNIKN